MIAAFDYRLKHAVAQAELLHRYNQGETAVHPYAPAEKKLVTTTKAPKRIDRNDPEALRRKADEFHGRRK